MGERLDPEPLAVPLSERDLRDDDDLIGVPLRSLFRPSLLRSLALIALAAAILLWPDRTDRALGILVGLGLVVYVVSASVGVIKERERRTFWAFLSIAGAGGCAAALMLHPADSLTSVTQVAGAAAIGAAVVEVVRMVRSWSRTAWQVAKTVGLLIGGALLIVYPLTLLAAATSLAAAGLAAIGVIEAFTPGSEPASLTGSAIPDTLSGWISRRSAADEDLSSLEEKVFFEGPTSSVRYLRFLTLMVLAATIASLGVVVDSTATVIGAMLIAPLMTPLMGTALSAAMGWPRRMRRSVGIALTGIAVAITTGALVGAIVPRTVDVTTNAQILARVSPTVVDLAIAIAAGAAGAYGLSRKDVSDALPGVAVAISLVPPLTVVGLSWQQGAWFQGNGALLLFLTNAAAILLAGGATFVLVGVAPLQRTSEGQERVTTIAVGVLSFVALVALLLLLNGSRLARAEFARAGVERTLATWTAAHEEFGVVDDRTLSDGTIVIDLAGPGRPPELDSLASDLAHAAGQGVQVRVRWVEQQQVSATG